MRLLDLYCGAGGAGRGYELAGFDEIVGVDNKPQPNYPYDVHLGQTRSSTWPRTARSTMQIHASPPCQGYSRHAQPARGCAGASTRC